MNLNIEELIRFYPILKNEEKDRINILISGKKFIISKSQVRISKNKKFNLEILVKNISGNIIR